MQLNLAGRVALVTGSSSGLGLAIATALADEGCAVALNGRGGERLERAVRRLRERAGARVTGLVADVSVPAQAEHLVAAAAAELGRVDILVCNAGGPPATPFRDAAADAWRAALDLNLGSTVQLCRAAVPAMRERRWGRIICLTSVAAKQPIAGLILSTTARAGVLGFAKALADELAPDGITVNSVCPGYMRTERVEELIASRAAAEGRPPTAVRETLVTAIPMRRIGEPAELAATVTFLASERAAYITGVALQVDGGLVRSIV